MNIPNNEGLACDAVIRHLEKWTGETRDEIRHPEKEGVGPLVELRMQLGDQHYDHNSSQQIDLTCSPSTEVRLTEVID